MWYFDWNTAEKFSLVEHQPMNIGRQAHRMAVMVSSFHAKIDTQQSDCGSCLINSATCWVDQDIKVIMIKGWATLLALHGSQCEQ
jgi:hypothetical protein